MAEQQRTNAHQEIVDGVRSLLLNTKAIIDHQNDIFGAARFLSENRSNWYSQAMEREIEENLKAATLALHAIHQQGGNLYVSHEGNPSLVFGLGYDTDLNSYTCLLGFPDGKPHVIPFSEGLDFRSGDN